MWFIHLDTLHVNWSIKLHFANTCCSDEWRIVCDQTILPAIMVKTRVRLVFRMWHNWLLASLTFAFTQWLRIVKLTVNIKLSFRDNIAFLDMLMHYLVNNLVWCSIISWLPVFVATIECGLPILATCIWGGLTLPNLFKLLHYQGNMNYDVNKHEFGVLSCMLVHSRAS